MASPMRNFEDAQQEPPVKTITRDLPNLRNPSVAADYKRQRTTIAAAARQQSDETSFWEIAQSDEGWI